MVVDLDIRLIVLGAALTLLVVAFVALVMSLVGASRRRRAATPEATPHVSDAGAIGPGEAVDASLEGLTLEVPPDSPSSALLLPLRTGDWQPPAEPAPAADLVGASLAARAGGHESPVPVVAPVPVGPDGSAVEDTGRTANLPEVRRTDEDAVETVGRETNEQNPESALLEALPVPEPEPAPEPALT